MEDIYLEPQKAFKQYVDINDNDINTFFDELVEKSGINIEENRQTVKQIIKKQQDINEQTKFINKKKALKGFLIFLCILGIIASAIFLFAIIANSLSPLFYIIPGVLIPACIAFIVLINKKFNPIINNANDLLNKMEKEKSQLLAIAYAQTKPLCDLFDWNMSSKLFSKTLPLIELDNNFNIKQYQFLHDRYGFDEDHSKTRSTLFVQSGSILGNPFLIKKDLKQIWGTQRYTGSLVIHWTTVTYDKDGNRHTHHHTQTLYAHVDKPIPRYYGITSLIYGNEAAPNLSFSRKSTNLHFKNEKEEDKYLKNFDKKLDKYTQDAISKNKEFQRMSNTEFEAYFNALDRDNNVEFRLLFTPLAQKNMLTLLKSTEPFGDDFDFIKSKKLNEICSSHSQTFDYSGNPEAYESYDYDIIKKRFVVYNKEYFKNLYYDFCPLLSIPLYQQTKTKEFIYEEDYETNITGYETEVLANSYDPKIFQNPKTATQVILKREFVGKNGESDINKIHAYSFEAVPRVEYISVLGGDGKYHNVPVNWDEYLAVEKATEFAVQNCNSTRQKFNSCYYNGKLNAFLSQCKGKDGIMYQRGLISLLINNQRFDGKALNSLLDKDKED